MWSLTAIAEEVAGKGRNLSPAARLPMVAATWFTDVFLFWAGFAWWSFTSFCACFIKICPVVTNARLLGYFTVFVWIICKLAAVWALFLWCVVSWGPLGPRVAFAVLFTNRPNSFLFSYELYMLYYSQSVGIKSTKMLGILMRIRKCTYDQFYEKVSRNCKTGVDWVVTWWWGNRQSSGTQLYAPEGPSPTLNS